MEQKTDQKGKYLPLILYVFFSILYVIPSIIYLLSFKTYGNFINIYFENYFFINTTNLETLQAILLFTIISALLLLFWTILKNSKKIFINKKNTFIFIFIIQLIFSLGTPVNSSDIFCYLGLSRLFEKGKANPYYQTLKEYVDYDDNLELDDVLIEGYTNMWSDTRLSYGPIHLFIYSIITKLSKGNINIAVLLAKLMMILINLLMCELIYKFFDKNIQHVLLYGINPFVIIATTVNCHNDSIFILFIMLAFYYAIKKENIIISLLFLSLSVNIKFVSLIFLPFIVLYYCRNRNIVSKILYCPIFAILFAEFTIIPWIPFFRDINVFACFFDQIGRTNNSIYTYLETYFPCYYEIVLRMTSVIFIFMYIIYCFKMLFAKEFDIRKNLKDLFYILLFFLFFVTTNLQFWYFIWLYVFIYFFERKKSLLIMVLQEISILYYPIYIASFRCFEIISIVFCLTGVIYGLGPFFFDNFMSKKNGPIEKPKNSLP